MTAEQLKTEIKSLWEKAGELKKYGKRPFTIDGLLLGSLGESFAETHLKLLLHENSVKKDHDATKDGKNYQIKTTQRTGVYFKKPLVDMELVFIFIKRDGGALPKLTVYHKISGVYIWGKENAERKYVGIQLLETLYKENKAQKEVI